MALYVGDTAGLVSRSFITNSGTSMVTKLVVFLLPVVMTMWIMRKSLTAAQIPVHFLAMVGCALLVLVLAVPMLSPAVQADVYGSFPGSLLKQMPDAIVGVSVALQLALMWITARPRHNQDAHHGRHRK